MEKGVSAVSTSLGLVTVESYELELILAVGSVDAFTALE